MPQIFDMRFQITLTSDHVADFRWVLFSDLGDYSAKKERRRNTGNIWVRRHRLLCRAAEQRDRVQLGFCFRNLVLQPPMQIRQLFALALTRFFAHLYILFARVFSRHSVLLPAANGDVCSESRMCRFDHCLSGRVQHQQLTLITPQLRQRIHIDRAWRGLFCDMSHRGYTGENTSIYTLCPKKRPPFYFSNNCQTLTDFYDFWCVKSWENLTSIACTFAHLACIL